MRFRIESSIEDCTFDSDDCTVENLPVFYIEAESAVIARRIAMEIIGPSRVNSVIALYEPIRPVDVQGGRVICQNLMSFFG